MNGNAADRRKIVEGRRRRKCALIGSRRNAVDDGGSTGNAAAVKVLLDHGANVNAVETAKGQTALMWAASERHAAAAKTLIEGGADVNARSKVTSTQGRGLYDGGAAAAPPRLLHPPKKWR